MTQRDIFLRVQRQLRRKCPLRLCNGQRTVSAMGEDVTHLEADYRSPELEEVAATHGCVVCPTLDGKWWVVAGSGGGLLRHVLSVFYDAAPSWGPHGVFLSYLSLVIVLPSEYSRVFVTRDLQPSLALCRQHFHERHPLWGFVFFTKQPS